MELHGRVVAVTGAASGIGRELAIELVGRGADVAISDVDEAGLADTVERCRRRAPGRAVTASTLDVADREAVEAWASAVVGDHGRVNGIINNAGVALVAPIARMSYDDLRWLMGINFWGVVHGTMAFLPHLKAAGEGHVVNISSVFGLTAIPSQSAYNASKFAVRGFTDCLRIELDLERAGVSATTVHPGGIRTNIVRNARIDPRSKDVRGRDLVREFDRVTATKPDKAARVILDGIERDKRRVLIGPDARVFDAMSRLPAAFAQRVVALGGRDTMG
jgi:NAD(P)-dependent dehydrogenase (short-subunit alcohol dehydrogenase family)